MSPTCRVAAEYSTTGDVLQFFTGMEMDLPTRMLLPEDLVNQQRAIFLPVTIYHHQIPRPEWIQQHTGNIEHSMQADNRGQLG